MKIVEMLKIALRSGLEIELKREGMKSEFAGASGAEHFVVV